MTAADATRLAGEAFSTRLARGGAAAPDDKMPCGRDRPRARDRAGDHGPGAHAATFIGEFQAARRLSGPTAIKGGDIFRVGLTRLRLGSTKEERVAIAAAAAVAKAK